MGHHDVFVPILAKSPPASHAGGEGCTRKIPRRLVFRGGLILTFPLVDGVAECLHLFAGSFRQSEDHAVHIAGDMQGRRVFS